MELKKQKSPVWVLVARYGGFWKTGRYRGKEDEICLDGKSWVGGTSEVSTYQPELGPRAQHRYLDQMQILACENDGKRGQEAQAFAPRGRVQGKSDCPELSYLVNQIPLMSALKLSRILASPSTLPRGRQQLTVSSPSRNFGCGPVSLLQGAGSGGLGQPRRHRLGGPSGGHSLRLWGCPVGT